MRCVFAAAALAAASAQEQIHLSVTGRANEMFVNREPKHPDARTAWTLTTDPKRP